MKKNFCFTFLALITFFQLGFHTTSFAQTPKIQLDINQAKTRKSLVAFPPLQFTGNAASTPNHQALGSELFRVISNNLSVSTYIQFISQGAFLEDTAKTGIKPVPQDPKGFQFAT